MRIGLVLAIMIAAVTMGVAAGATSGAVVSAFQGDPAAWEAVVGTYKKLNMLSGYRMTIIVSGTGGGILERGLLEFAYPNRRHVTLQLLHQTTEAVDVGSEFRLRLIGTNYPSTWRCMTAPQTRGLDDPRDFSDGHAVTRGPDTVLNGAAVRVYVFPSGHPPSTAEHTLYIGAKTGLPRRHVILERFGVLRTTRFDYRDYGEKIEIKLPPCG